MSRKVLLLGVVIVLLGAGLWIIGAQEEEAHPIITTASSTVGVGTYVAAEAFALPGSEEEPAPTAYILPYAIYINTGLMSVEEFVQPEPLEGFTFAWSLEGADLLVDGPVAIFMAESAGQYTLTLTATDEAGNVAETSWVVTASTYVGSGTMTGEAEHNQCANCHEDNTEGWLATGHSDMLVRGLDGVLSSHYGEACISCHTTGFGLGENGGFDDAAAASGWTFPETLEAGQWDALVTNFPDVADMGNIQCESCHGPGFAHATEGVASNRMISTELGYGVCAQCHGEETHHVFPMQWENSNHATGSAWTAEVGNQTCAQCHSGEGFIDFADGLPEEEWRSGLQNLTCASCHDPHDATNPFQLRIYDTAVLPEGEVTGVGVAATCMSCHNGRRAGGAAGQVDGFATAGRLSMPHEGNNEAELLTTGGGYTWGETLPTSPHSAVVEGVCTGCHMGPTPGFDNYGTPDDSSDDQALPGRHTVGGHSFAVESEAAGENVVVCQGCHIGATTFEYESARDYDGDGAIETIQEEVAGLRENLFGLLTAGGIVDAEMMRGFTLPENPSVELLGAFWNYHFTGMPGTAVHNFRYSVALLQLSIAKLGGTSGAPLPAR